MKKVFKYLVLFIIIVLVGYKSVYFKKLSDTNTSVDNTFDATAYSKKLWEEKFPGKLDSAIQLTTLIDMIRADPDRAFAQNTSSMSIGNYRYALVKVPVVIDKINTDDINVHLQTGADTTLQMILATEYIYGNSVRDASALVNINDFTNTTDLNNISEELNRIIRRSVLPSFKQTIKEGEKAEITGAIELNKEHINFNELELIPIRIKPLQ